MKPLSPQQHVLPDALLGPQTRHAVHIPRQLILHVWKPNKVFHTWSDCCDLLQFTIDPEQNASFQLNQTAKKVSVQHILSSGILFVGILWGRSLRQCICSPLLVGQDDFGYVNSWTGGPGWMGLLAHLSGCGSTSGGLLGRTESSVNWHKLNDAEQHARHWKRVPWTPMYFSYFWCFSDLPELN